MLAPVTSLERLPADAANCTLTALECQLLPLGTKTITLENGVRFLADYLDGDHYYPVHRPGPISSW